MRHPALLLTLALSFLPAAHAAPAQPKAQQLAVFKVAALASATSAHLRATPDRDKECMFMRVLL